LLRRNTGRRCRLQRSQKPPRNVLLRIASIGGCDGSCPFSGVC
jgi:hypothetical protein